MVALLVAVAAGTVTFDAHAGGTASSSHLVATDGPSGGGSSGGGEASGGW